MWDESVYRRLNREYSDIYSLNKTRSVTNGYIVARFVTAAVLIAIFIIEIALFADDNRPRKYFVISMPPIAAVLSVAAGIYEKRKWDKSEELIARSTAYECAVTECGLTVNRGKYSSTTLLFKFVYNKNGEQVADMLEILMSGVYKGEVPRIRIVMYETPVGEKVISMTPPPDSREFAKHEHRTICR